MEFDDDFPIFECSNCEGRGEIPDDEAVDEDGYPIMVGCHVCGGRGIED